MEQNKALEIYNEIAKIYPNACCELVYHNPFEMVVATILSAQATDISVNKVTPFLFSKYPSAFELAKAKYDDVYEIIKPIGLAKNKTNNIINLAIELVNKYNGEIIPDFNILTSLPGVGRKTANVVLAEAYDVPRIGVDTHVKRVSNILGLSNNSDVIKIEEDLMNLYPKEMWKDVHLKLLFFGRYTCKAMKPNCDECPFVNCIKKK